MSVAVLMGSKMNGNKKIANRLHPYAQEGVRHLVVTLGAEGAVLAGLAAEPEPVPHPRQPPRMQLWHLPVRAHYDT